MIFNLNENNKDVNDISLSFTSNYEFPDKINELSESTLNQFLLYEQSFNESKDMEIFDSNHKKKTGKKFKYIDIDTTEGVKYLSTDPKSKKNLDYIKKNRRGEIVVCVDDDKLAGYIFVCKDKRNDGYIQPLYLFKEYRGYGLSNNLLKDAINKYDAEDLSVLQDNKVAIDLYKKHGFVVVGNDNTNKSKEGQLVYMKLKSKLNESYIEEGINDYLDNNYDRELGLSDKEKKARQKKEEAKKKRKEDDEREKIMNYNDFGDDNTNGTEYNFNESSLTQEDIEYFNNYV